MDKKELGKWGNSLSIRIPYKYTKALEWKEGDEIEMEMFNKTLVLKQTEDDVKEDILKTIEASLDYIIYNRENGVIDEEVEKSLLKTINFGIAVLLEDELQTSEEACLKMAQIAVNRILSFS